MYAADCLHINVRANHVDPHHLGIFFKGDWESEWKRQAPWLNLTEKEIRWVR
jgi:hypothetical protein|tara:strand:- start:171 stop:326 length:156 start_codon:yes stop_codon:yes gene_type:complete